MTLYPETEPFSEQMLAVSPRHSLYVERSGKPGGYPVLFLHGGPGSHTRPAHRRYFDPDFFEIVLFDQRGCGKSVPAGETQDNNTSALVEDILQVCQSLGIKRRFSLVGGSWGSTLALAFAKRYPGDLDEMILRGVFLATDAELHWYLYGLSRFAPAAWQQFARDMGDDLLQSYFRAVFDNDLQVACAAAARWVAYETELMSTGAMLPRPTVNASTASGVATAPPAVPSARAVLDRARVQLHYLAHQCFLTDSPLLDAAPAINVPVTIVQGVLDLLCPPITAYQLSQRLPAATLRLVPDAGHGALSGSLALALKEECDALRDRLCGRATALSRGNT